MYKLIESPVVELEITKNGINSLYIKNIYKILKYDSFNLFIINSDYNSDHNEENHLLSPIVEYIKTSNKMFLVDLNFYINHFKKSQNIPKLFVYEILCADKISRCSEFDSNNLDIIFIKFDTSISSENYLWEDIQQLINNSSIDFFALFNNEKINIKNYNEIIGKIIKFNINLNFNSIYKDYLTVKEHPCNAYLCSKEKCHANKSKLPRYLFVSCEGIYPYKVTNTRLIITEHIDRVVIDNFDDILNDYIGSEEYNNFIDCNKYIFFQYVLTKTTNIFAWNLFLIDALNNI